MDDANVPSLLAMPYLGDMDVNDPIYQNTRRFVWSEANPYFFRGSAGEGIGGPHVGYDMAWPMSIMMKAFTSQDDAEIKRCVEMLMTTDAGTGFMHESFNVNDPDGFHPLVVRMAEHAVRRADPQAGERGQGRPAELDYGKITGSVFFQEGRGNIAALLSFFCYLCIRPKLLSL